jgi:hypothetical protein
MKHMTGPALLFLYLLFAPGDAFGYIDPGGGSYALQLLAAGLLGALFALKVFWRNVKAAILGWFSKGKKGSDAPK